MTVCEVIDRRIKDQTLSLSEEGVWNPEFVTAEFIRAVIINTRRTKGQENYLGNFLAQPPINNLFTKNLKPATWQNSNNII